MAQHIKTGLHVTQIGANSSDLVGTLRVFHEAFGFVNAGGNGIWGETLALHGLPPTSKALHWFMVGAQKYVHLEFLHHTSPTQRPKRSDWKSSDLGWNRFGIAVSDFDACLGVLESNHIPTITPPITECGLRRVAFVEPFIQAIVEVIEKSKVGGAPDGPRVVYAASSVSNINSARDFYQETLGLIVEANTLHQPAHEALWGLRDAERETFIARADGDILIEVVQYHHPQGRPRAPDYRMSDQGMVNITLGSRDKDNVVALYERISATGIVAPRVVNSKELFCANLNEPEREFELTCVPEHLDAIAGLIPSLPFLT